MTDWMSLLSHLTNRRWNYNACIDKWYSLYINKKLQFAVHIYVIQIACKLNKEDSMDRCKWRKVIKEARWSGWVWVVFLLVPAYPGCPGSKAVKRSLLLYICYSMSHSLPCIICITYKMHVMEKYQLKFSWTDACCVAGLAGASGAWIPSAVGLQCMYWQLGGYGGETTDGESVQRATCSAAAAAAALRAGERSETCLPCRTDAN